MAPGIKSVLLMRLLPPPPLLLCAVHSCDCQQAKLQTPLPAAYLCAHSAAACALFGPAAATALLRQDSCRAHQQGQWQTPSAHGARLPRGMVQLARSDGGAQVLHEGERAVLGPVLDARMCSLLVFMPCLPACSHIASGCSPTCPASPAIPSCPAFRAACPPAPCCACAVLFYPTYALLCCFAAPPPTHPPHPHTHTLPPHILAGTSMRW